MNTFSKNFQITYRDVDCKNNMKLNTVIDFMQDMSRLHATKLGVDYASDDSPYYWIVIRTSITIDHYPKLNDVIRMETHIVGLDSIYSVRRFDFYDEENTLLGYILAYYLLMDKSSHRPVKTKVFKEALTMFHFSYDGDKLKKFTPTIVETKKSITRTAFSGDIDSNNHMNNAHYVRWALDMFSVSELLAQPIKTFQIQYINEIREGDQVTLDLSLDTCGDTYIIGRMKESSQIHFISKCIF